MVNAINSDSFGNIAADKSSPAWASYPPTKDGLCSFAGDLWEAMSSLDDEDVTIDELLEDTDIPLPVLGKAHACLADYGCPYPAYCAFWDEEKDEVESHFDISFRVFDGFHVENFPEIYGDILSSATDDARLVECAVQKFGDDWESAADYFSGLSFYELPGFRTPDENVWLIEEEVIRSVIKETVKEANAEKDAINAAYKNAVESLEEFRDELTDLLEEHGLDENYRIRTDFTGASLYLEIYGPDNKSFKWRISDHDRLSGLYDRPDYCESLKNYNPTETPIPISQDRQPGDHPANYCRFDDGSGLIDELERFFGDDWEALGPALEDMCS